MRICWDEGPVITAAIGLTIVLGATAPLLLARALARAVDAVGPAVESGAALNQLVRALVVVGALFGLQQALVPLVDTGSDVVGLRVRGAVFRRTMAALLAPASVAHLEDPETADVVAVATASNQYGPRSAVVGLANQVLARASGTGALLVVLLYRWWAGVLLVAAMVHLAGRVRGGVVSVATAQHAQTRNLRRADYLQNLVLTPPAAKEIRVFGLGDWLVGRFAWEWRTAMATVWERRRGILREQAIGMVPAAAVIAMIGALAARDAVSGAISVGTASAVLYALVAAPNVANVTAWDNWLELGLGSIRAVEDLEAAIAGWEGRMTGAVDASHLALQRIAFEGVSFAYPGAARAVFSDLDLTIEAGTSLAIVGENGAGKTTLVKLLTRLYDPTGGRVTVDGVDLQDIDPRSWHARTAAICQDFTRLPMTVRENVTFFGEEATPDELEGAAVAAGAGEIVEGLPEGWDTVLSRQFGGTDLSGGQWQRIALARALLAAERGAPILVLDEPTAQLDVRQEAAFYERFLEVTRGRTAIVISHRFSTVRRADRIVVLRDGRVIEDGTHDQLLRAGGDYARMFELQASRFREDDHVA
ncbi:MAG: ABC transporter ATP-binding protein [Mycobacteriales bacterium]